MSWILTRREDECLVKICAEIGEIESLEVRLLLFDGCEVHRDGEGARENIENVLMKMPSLIGMGVVLKPWGSRTLGASPIAASLILTGKARVDTTYEMALSRRGFAEDCLPQAAMYAECTGSAPKFPGSGPFCVSDFNALSTASTNAGEILQLEHTSIPNVTPVDFVAFTRLPQRIRFFGARMLGDGTVTLVVGAFRSPAFVDCALFLQELNAREGSLLFRLVSATYPIMDRDGRYAYLGGAGIPLRDWGNTRAPIARCFVSIL